MAGSAVRKYRAVVPEARRAPAALVGIAGALAVHLTLLWWWQGASTQRLVADLRLPEAAWVTLRLIPLPVMPRPVTSPEPKAPEKTPADPRPPVSGRRSVLKAASKRAAEPARAAKAQNPAPSTSIVEPTPTLDPTVALPVEPAAAASNPGRAAPLLLDTEATRRAIRESARGVSLGERLDTARGEPGRFGSPQRLGNAVEASGKGDCAKGEYAGGGMGLLSVPFLAAAVSTGDCAK